MVAIDKDGTYKFLVKAVNSEGSESTTAASIDFIVLPPLWRRWWFEGHFLRTALGTAFSGAALTVHAQNPEAKPQGPEAVQVGRVTLDRDSSYPDGFPSGLFSSHGNSLREGIRTNTVRNIEISFALSSSGRRCTA